MKHSKKRLWITAGICAVILILTVVLLSALPRRPEEPTPQEPVTITLVYAYQNNLWNTCVEEVIRRFEEDHPGVDVLYEIRYEDEVYEDMLSKLLARDELGDVVQLKEPYAWAESGLIAPLPAELAEQVAVRCELDGTTYAVAALGATTGVVYNRAVFQNFHLSPPQSYREFLALCATLKRQGITPLGVGGKDLWHFEYWMNHFFRSDVLSAQPDFLALCAAGERTWSDPLITEMLTHLSQLFRMGYVSADWPATPDGALAYHMAKGEVAMVFSGPWLAAEILELAPELELGWFYVPNTAGQVVAGDSVDVFWAVTQGCARDEAKREAALAFLDYFYSSGVYEEVYTAMAGYSTLTDQSRNRAPDSDVLSQVLSARDAADLRVSDYIGDRYTPAGFEKKLLSLMTELCAGRLTVAQTQELAQQAWDQCLEREAAYEP